MGRYNTARQVEKPRAHKELHPIWRGIGFVFLIFAPIMGYYGTRLILDLNAVNHWFPIPSTLLNRNGIDFLGKIGQNPMLFIYIIMTIVLTFLFYAFLQLLSFILYGLFGPKRYGIYDAPPANVKNRKKSR